MMTFKFEELFGFEFGARKNTYKYPDRDAGEFEITFKTPTHSEDSCRFFFSQTAIAFGGDLMIQCFDGENLLYSDSEQLDFFVNLDGVDPRTGTATGHPRIGPRIRDTHLLPGREYRLIVRRLSGHNSRQPIGIRYYGTDKNEVEYGSKAAVPAMYNGVYGVFVPND